MSHVNLKSRPSIDLTSQQSATEGKSAAPQLAAASGSSAYHSRTYSPPRVTAASSNSSLIGAYSFSSSALKPIHSNTNDTIVGTTTNYTSNSTPPHEPSAQFGVSGAANNAGGGGGPASAILRVELDHARTVIDRLNENAHRHDREKKSLQEQLEVSRREAREAKEATAAEWRKRTSDAVEENDRLRSDMAALHEEIAELRANLAEAQRSEKKAEGFSAKLRDTEDALFRQEAATNEARKGKQLLEKELDELRRNNPAFILQSKIQQQSLELEIKEGELRQKQTDIVSLTKKLHEAESSRIAMEERLKNEERHAASLLVETQDLSKRLLETEKKWSERESELKKTAADHESNAKLVQQRLEDALHSRDMAEQTLAAVQRDHKRHSQGSDLHLVQRAAEIESLLKQLDVYKNKLNEAHRELSDCESKIAYDRKARDALEAEVSRSAIIQQDLKLTNDRLQREFLRVEKDNETLYKQLNTVSERLLALGEEKMKLEKTLEAANIKVELSAKASENVEKLERQLSERNSHIVELESKLRTLDPHATRLAAMREENEKLNIELRAETAEVKELRATLEEERDAHSRAHNRVRLLEAKLAQSDDRHEEMYNKLRTLELMTGGDRATGQQTALHEKIRDTDLEKSRLLETNVKQSNDLRKMEEAMRDMEKQVARAREITREAEMAKVRAEIERDEALPRDSAATRPTIRVSGSSSPLPALPFGAASQNEAERKAYAEAIQTLQTSLNTERAANERLRQQLTASDGLVSVISAEKSLNAQLEEENRALTRALGIEEGNAVAVGVRGIGPADSFSSPTDRNRYSYKGGGADGVSSRSSSPITVGDQFSPTTSSHVDGAEMMGLSHLIRRPVGTTANTESIVVETSAARAGAVLTSPLRETQAAVLRATATVKASPASAVSHSYREKEFSSETVATNGRSNTVALAANNPGRTVSPLRSRYSPLGTKLNENGGGDLERARSPTVPYRDNSDGNNGVNGVGSSSVVASASARGQLEQMALEIANQNKVVMVGNSREDRLEELAVSLADALREMKEVMKEKDRSTLAGGRGRPSEISVAVEASSSPMKGSPTASTRKQTNVTTVRVGANRDGNLIGARRRQQGGEENEDSVFRDKYISDRTPPRRAPPGSQQSQRRTPSASSLSPPSSPTSRGGASPRGGYAAPTASSRARQTARGAALSDTETTDAGRTHSSKRRERKPLRALEDDDDNDERRGEEEDGLLDFEERERGRRNYAKKSNVPKADGGGRHQRSYSDAHEGLKRAENSRRPSPRTNSSRRGDDGESDYQYEDHQHRRLYASDLAKRERQRQQFSGGSDTGNSSTQTGGSRSEKHARPQVFMSPAAPHVHVPPSLSRSAPAPPTAEIDPSVLDDDELLRELDAAKRRMKRALMSDRLMQSPSPSSKAKGGVFGWSGGAREWEPATRARY